MKRRYFILAACLSLLILLGVGLLGFRPAGGQAQDITIPEGASTRQVARDLKSRGLIRSELHFLVAARLTGSLVKAGEYAIDPTFNVFAVLRTLGQVRMDTISITIPEGWRREQIARLLTEKGLDGDGFLALTEEQEGYLFPDTYFFKKDAEPQAVLDKFTENFTERTKDLNPTREQMILASIVEREAKRDDERALIAGIYMNRITKGMPLEADPTVQYAKDTNRLNRDLPVDEFWTMITVADYTGVVSPYNAYLNKGYPPGPIANPGLKSITAAVNPQSTDAVYFFHISDGSIITSKTLDEHNANKRKHLR